MPKYKPLTKAARDQILNERLNFMRENAGKLDAESIAAKLGISRGYLSTLGSKHKISLKLPNALKPTKIASKANSIDIEILKQRAGKEKRQDIADFFGISLGYLSQIASKHKISLRLDEDLSKKKEAKRPQVSEEELEAASKLLRSQGYTVLRPDPFRATYSSARKPIIKEYEKLTSAPNA